MKPPHDRKYSVFISKEVMSKDNRQEHMRMRLNDDEAKKQIDTRDYIDATKESEMRDRN